MNVEERHDADFLSSPDDLVSLPLDVEISETSINNAMSSPESATGCKRTDGDVPDESALAIAYGDVKRPKRRIIEESSSSDESYELSKARKDRLRKEEAQQKRRVKKMKAAKLREKQLLE